MSVSSLKSIWYRSGGHKANRGKGRRRPCANFFIPTCRERERASIFLSQHESIGSDFHHGHQAVRTSIESISVLKSFLILTISFEFWFPLLSSTSRSISLFLFLSIFKTTNLYRITYYIMYCAGALQSGSEFITVPFRCVFLLCSLLVWNVVATELPIVWKLYTPVLALWSFSCFFFISSTEDDQRVRSLTASWQ